VVDVKSPDPVTGMMLQGMMAPGYMATQIDIINSDRVAKQVITSAAHGTKALPFNPMARSYPEAKANWWTGWPTLLQKSLDVKPSRESNVININYTGADPEFAASRSQRLCQSLYGRQPRPALGPGAPVCSFL
jgi:succinoglycan biosynthesis transport protein ExoP